MTCELEHPHWGLFGAAGLLAYVVDPAAAADPDRTLVLMQHRAKFAHQGGTWALPGGAMDEGESPAEAALREADEECMLDPKLVVPRGYYTDEHGGWAYHTVLAQAAEPVRVYPGDHESDESLWVPAGEVDRLDLHPGFAATWPVLRQALLPLTIVVDARGLSDGAAPYRRAVELTRTGLATPPGAVPGPPLDRWYPDYVLVLDPGAAAAAETAAADDAARAEAAKPKLASWQQPLVVPLAAVHIVTAAPEGLLGHRLTVGREFLAG